MYDLVVSKDSEKFLEKQTQQMRVRVVDALGKLRANPLNGKPLHGDLEGLFSLRIGGMRAVYEVDSKSKTIVVHAVGFREDIYKK